MHSQLSKSFDQNKISHRHEKAEDHRSVRIDSIFQEYKENHPEQKQTKKKLDLFKHLSKNISSIPNHELNEFVKNMDFDKGDSMKNIQDLVIHAMHSKIEQEVKQIDRIELNRQRRIQVSLIKNCY